MATRLPRKAAWSDVVVIGRALGGVEESTSYGTPALKVKGKLFVRLHEDGDTLVLRTTAEDRAYLLATWPRVFYLTPHYEAHPWVLARLGAIGRARLREVLGDAWRRVAPKSLLTARSSDA